MKILITEVLLDAYHSVYNISFNDKFKTSWDNGLIEYSITEELMSELLNKGVVGWVHGVTPYGVNVKRTYMLVEED